MSQKSITTWFKNYAEFIVYGIVIAGLMVWQGLLFDKVIKIHQDLLIATFGLQILNIILAIAVAKKMRLLSQLLLLSGILFGSVVIYYIKVLLANVI